MEPEELTGLALEAATQAGAGYADARWVREETEGLTVTDDRVDDLEAEDSSGLGVRVLVDGRWGFAASVVLDPARARGLARRAVEVARASAALPSEPVRLAPVGPAVATWSAPVRRDPFAVPLAERVELLLAACDAQRSVPGLAHAKATVDLWRRRTVLWSTEGARIDQTVTQTGAGIEAAAVGDGDLQQRSWPNSFRGQFQAGGWEIVEAADLVGNAPRVAAEAVALLQAPLLPEAVTTVILDGQQLSLQVHESVGHPLELDRILGMEAAYAGTSFVEPGDLGRLRYGSAAMSVTADATTPGGLGTFAFDDEGVPAQRSPLVAGGVVAGFLTSRETTLDGAGSGGAMRADGWGAMPLIRMTNVHLEPGQGSLEELVADTPDGLLLSINRSWSIDDRRVNFQFGVEAAWEIKGGRLGRLYRNATYDGRTTQFWGSLDAVCGPGAWVVWGVPNCGKGQPFQNARVGHGAAPARFHRVHVGVGR
ncbi:MAG TPA: TldD/PmbA family protein [Actinomycetota bacterium]|nr:TldD/PmbA family protein [Actinomycetota bacterium]